MTTEIRALTDADVDAVVRLSLRAWAPVFASFEQVLGGEIYRRLFPDWTSSQARDVARVCREHAATTWVAVAGAEPVGFVVAVLDPASGGGELEMIAVDPAHQRRGIATDLIAFAVDQLRAAGARLVAIGTGGDPGHAPARRAYEKAGFTALPQVRYYKAV
ncbi:GNAT family N-acetyltransferase [Amorphoplanes nipponensis]|uniref:GNAT family N-acetyltransferase n=1 Tax=Actinoplanes nipponensis TaxID=135950 RepID=A0A919JKD1_9ACTN|nr:GNAT family N-acetyltransferase [Actinoplanes nipponensis]GIE48369.1 GNAT family N-acetyltransferase [Actinoplanes nipponensis]